MGVWVSACGKKAYRQRYKCVCLSVWVSEWLIAKESSFFISFSAKQHTQSLSCTAPWLQLRCGPIITLSISPTNSLHFFFLPISFKLLTVNYVSSCSIRQTKHLLSIFHLYFCFMLLFLLFLLSIGIGEEQGLHNYATNEGQ